MTDSFETANVETSYADELRATWFHVGADEYAVFSFDAQEDAAPEGLTAGERSVFHGLLSGQSNRMIASNRRSAPSTVANQVAAIFRKLAVGSRGELIARYAVRARSGDQNRKGWNGA